MEGSVGKKAHLAILPSPGIGHFIPLVEFAKRIIGSHGFSVTFVSVSADATSEAQKAVVDSLHAADASTINIPPVDLSDIPPRNKIETRISLTVLRSLSPLRDVLLRLRSTARLVGLVVDLFGTDAIDVASDLGLPTYIFIPTNALCINHVIHIPDLDAKYSCEFRDVPEPIAWPGCIPVHGRDLLDPFQDRRDEAYRWMMHHGLRYRLAKGIILNSFPGVEPEAIKALTEMGSPRVYPVGPVIRPCSGTDGLKDDPCLRWLDEQPLGSVLFVSFGSGGTLSAEQMTELALGLELSEQRFLWVVRSPHEEEANGSYFSVRSKDDPMAFLPTGFLSRTKDSGLVVPSWAPQAHVLGHGSTGGFLSHCGWNSTLESIVNGVPIIAWPLFAEQRTNAVILAEGLGVALRPKGRTGSETIGREEIARVVKALMEGEEGKRLRSRMRELKDSASMALSEGGSSSQALAALARDLTESEAAS